MVTVRTTVKKLLEWLKDMEGGKFNREFVYPHLREILETTLFAEVFKNHYKVYEIPTKGELKNLIRAGGRSHRPARPKKARYDNDYLKRKLKKGESLPHKWENYGFWKGTTVKVVGDRVIVSTNPQMTVKAGFNYGILHESKKSVVKATMLLSWDTMMKQIIKDYAKALRV